MSVLTANPNDVPINWDSHPISKVFANGYLADQILDLIDDRKAIWILLNVNRAIRCGLLSTNAHWKRLERIVFNRKFLPTYYPPQNTVFHDPEIEKEKRKKIASGEWPQMKGFERFGDFAFEEFIVGKILRMPYWFAVSADTEIWNQLRDRGQFIKTLVLDGTAVTGRGLFGSVAMPTRNDVYRTSAGLLSHLSGRLEHLSLRFCPNVQHSDIAIFLLMPPTQWVHFNKLKTLRVYGCGEAPTEGPFQNLPGFGSKNKITQKADNILNIQILSLLFPSCLPLKHHRKYSVPLTVEIGGWQRQRELQKDQLARFDALNRAGWFSQAVFHMFPVLPLTLLDPLFNTPVPGPFGGFIGAMHESLMLRSICIHETIKLDWGLCVLGADCYSFKVENFTPIARINYRSGRTTGLGHMYGALAEGVPRRQEYHDFRDGIVPRIPVALSALIPGKYGQYVPYHMEASTTVPITGENQAKRKRPTFLSMHGHKFAPHYHDPGLTGETCRTVAGLSGEGVHMHCAVGAGRRKELGGTACANCGLWEYEHYFYDSRVRGEGRLRDPGREIVGELCEICIPFYTCGDCGEFFCPSCVLDRGLDITTRDLVTRNPWATVQPTKDLLRRPCSIHGATCAPCYTAARTACIFCRKFVCIDVGRWGSLSAVKLRGCRKGIGDKFIEDHGVQMIRDRHKETTCQNCFERQLAWVKTETQRINVWKHVGVNILQREQAASKAAEAANYREWTTKNVPLSTFEKRKKARLYAAGSAARNDQLPDGQGPRIVELDDNDEEMHDASTDSSSDESEIDPENTGANHPLLKQMDKLYADLAQEITAGKVIPQGMTEVLRSIRNARHHIERSKVAEVVHKKRRKAAKASAKRAKQVKEDADPALKFSPTTYYGPGRLYREPAPFLDLCDPVAGWDKIDDFAWIPTEEDINFFQHRLQQYNDLYWIPDHAVGKLEYAIEAEKRYRESWNERPKPITYPTWHTMHRPEGWENRKDCQKLKRKADGSPLDSEDAFCIGENYKDASEKIRDKGKGKQKMEIEKDEDAAKEEVVEENDQMDTTGETEMKAQKEQKVEATNGKEKHEIKTRVRSGGILAKNSIPTIEAERERYVRQEIRRLGAAFKGMRIAAGKAKPGEKTRVLSDTQTKPPVTEPDEDGKVRFADDAATAPEVKVDFANDPAPQGKTAPTQSAAEPRKLATISSKWTKFTQDRADREKKTGEKQPPIAPQPPTKAAMKKFRKEVKESMKKVVTFTQTASAALNTAMNEQATRLAHRISAMTTPLVATAPAAGARAPALPSLAPTLARGTAVRLGIASGRVPPRTAAMMQNGVPRTKQWDGVDEEIADDEERGYIA
ncbi:hypothetical protein ABW21_db0200566 [Orbilia brochopaga]|nr:hypothetical protein ABW21_db0200566 [Drechslerella brochopaga]